MSDSNEYTQLNDPEFLAERKRVRETLEALQARMLKLDNEFLRRVGIQWAPASQG